MRGHSDFIVSVAFDPKGDRVVTASRDGTARLWDALTGDPTGIVIRGHTAALTSVAFSLDGDRIITASWDGTARVWDAHTGASIGNPIKGHSDIIASAVFSPNGERILTASWDKTARQWDARKGTPLGEPLTGHEGTVRTAVYDRDGARILTASGDGSARIWNAHTGKTVGRALRGHEAEVLAAAFGPEVPVQLSHSSKDDSNYYVLTASRDGTARLGASNALSDRSYYSTEELTPRCLTPALRQEFFLDPAPPLWCMEQQKWPYTTTAWKNWISDVRRGKVGVSLPY
jgi:WD40 repeat protein